MNAFSRMIRENTGYGHRDSDISDQNYNRSDIDYSALMRQDSNKEPGFFGNYPHIDSTNTGCQMGHDERNEQLICSVVLDN